MDLLRHYRLLLEEVLDYRRAGSLGADFPAAEYFQLLPPAGPLPKEAIDPVQGRQGFFPEAFNVWVAPIRSSDLATVVKESMPLPPIDLGRQEPLDIVVLAPLSSQDYGYFASRLERAFDPATRRLPFLDLLSVRLYGRRPTHDLDDDQKTWQAIWERVAEQDLTYIRRPTRAAETAISGIVLAKGIEPEPPGSPAEPQPELPPSPADTGGLVVDEDQVLLERVNLKRLAELRPPIDEAGEKALASLQAELGGDAGVVLGCLNALLRIERQYDPLLWQTLRGPARHGALPKFVERLRELQTDATTGLAVAKIGSEFGLDQELLDQWLKLAER